MLFVVAVTLKFTVSFLVQSPMIYLFFIFLELLKYVSRSKHFRLNEASMHPSEQAA